MLPCSRRWSRGVAEVLAGLALCAMPAAAEPVKGTIATHVRPGAVAAIPVVYAERLDGPPLSRPGNFAVTQKGKAFSPRVLAVPLGSSVSFPNQDPIFHNVFSLSLPQPFDLGLYRSGAAKTRTFTEPAVYFVFCNIHPQMSAFLVVSPSAWVATAGPDGTWSLDLPAGRYRITALSERASPVAIEVTVKAGGADVPALSLDESVAVTTPHLNKFGKPYPKAAYADK